MLSGAFGETFAFLRKANHVFGLLPVALKYQRLSCHFCEILNRKKFPSTLAAASCIVILTELYSTLFGALAIFANFPIIRSGVRQIFGLMCIKPPGWWWIDVSRVDCSVHQTSLLVRERSRVMFMMCTELMEWFVPNMPTCVRLLCRVVCSRPPERCASKFSSNTPKSLEWGAPNFRSVVDQTSEIALPLQFFVSPFSSTSTWIPFAQLQCCTLFAVTPFLRFCRSSTRF